MQTFLPYANFRQSAESLDRQRLGKQRVEVLQILNALLGDSQGWRSHPAVKMWQGYETVLIEYGLVVCEEWTRRGYKDTCAEKIFQYLKHASAFVDAPPWLGDESFHASHRSNLLRKDPDHYRQFNWTEGPDLPYVWPIS